MTLTDKYYTSNMHEDIIYNLKVNILVLRCFVFSLPKSAMAVFQPLMMIDYACTFTECIAFSKTSAVLCVKVVECILFLFF